MNSRLMLAAALAFPILVVAPAAASPISYAFAGTLDTPFNGSREFSGTVTFEANTDRSSAPWWPGYGNGSIPNDERVEGLVDESAEMTLNAGGQTFRFSSSRLQVDGLIHAQQPSWLSYIPTPPPQDELMILGSAALDSPASGDVSFGIMTYTPASLVDLSDLGKPDFGLGASSIYMTYHNNADGTNHQGGGTITSFTPVATPEPGGWMIALVVVGVGAAWLRRAA